MKVWIVRKTFLEEMDENNCWLSKQTMNEKDAWRPIVSQHPVYRYQKTTHMHLCMHRARPADPPHPSTRRQHKIRAREHTPNKPNGPSFSKTHPNKTNQKEKQKQTTKNESQQLKQNFLITIKNTPKKQM